MAQKLALVGDGIENPLNARTLADAAAMFGSACLFRDRKGLAERSQQLFSDTAPFTLTTREDLAARHSPIIACDNAHGADDVYGFRLPEGPRPVLVVGNERHGIARDLLSIADRAVQIPMRAPRLNTLNVAAAAVVALYYLTRRTGAPMRVRSAPEQSRPEVLLLGATDHFELGSAIRSAAALGWRRLLVENRASVWFGSDRRQRTEGRAAARWARNSIKLFAAQPSSDFSFESVWVLNTEGRGVPLHRAHLDRGQRDVVVVPDERAVRLDDEDWTRLSKRVRFTHIEAENPDITYHYHLIASIALAEAARQIGRASGVSVGRRYPRPSYPKALPLLPAAPHRDAAPVGPGVLLR